MARLSFAQIVMAHDQRDLLPRAVDSVLSQTLLPDVVVIADDGSTDGTGEVAEAIARRHPHRVVLALSETNRGIGANLNAAVRATDADYLSVLAADDYLLPGKLEAQISWVRRVHPRSQVCYSDARYLLEETGRTKVPRNRIKEGRVFPYLARRRFAMRNFWFSRLLFDDIGGYDTTLSLLEDWKLKMELSLRTEVSYCPGVFSVYSQSAGGAHRLPRQVQRECAQKIAADLAARYRLSPRERGWLAAAVKHYQFLAERRPLPRLQALAAAWAKNPSLLVTHVERALDRARGLPRGP